LGNEDDPTYLDSGTSFRANGGIMASQQEFDGRMLDVL
jgi:hypothetical protein